MATYSVSAARTPPHVDGDDAQAIGHLGRHHVQQVARELDALQADPRDGQLVGQDLRELELGHEALGHQLFAQPAPRVALGHQRLAHLFGP
jgi:hypothetical protein